MSISATLKTEVDDLLQRWCSHLNKVTSKTDVAVQPRKTVVIEPSIDYGNSIDYEFIESPPKLRYKAPMWKDMTEKQRKTKLKQARTWGPRLYQVHDPIREAFLKDWSENPSNC